jgi:hypothetical protein
MKKLSYSYSGALRQFSHWVANGTVGLPLLENIDYWQTLHDEPSAMEQLYAIFASIIEMNDEGEVTNARYAERRAAQWLRSYTDPTYEVSPPFEDWEVHLY